MNSAWTRCTPGALVAIGAALAASTTWSTDLALVDRRILREPAYDSIEQKYCLLVFGAEAADRAWIVIDGDVVYVDRNGNGDLTEEGEQTRFADIRSSRDDSLVASQFATVDDLQIGAFKHGQLQVHRNTYSADVTGNAVLTGSRPDVTRIDESYFELRLYVNVRSLPGLRMNAAGQVLQSAGDDSKGRLQFASSPEAAPVVHFAGPLSMDLRVGSSGADDPATYRLFVDAGTPGLGAGSFAAMAYDGLIPRNVHPLAKISFPGTPARSTVAACAERC